MKHCQNCSQPGLSALQIITCQHPVCLSPSLNHRSKLPSKVEGILVAAITTQSPKWGPAVRGVAAQNYSAVYQLASEKEIPEPKYRDNNTFIISINKNILSRTTHYLRTR